MSFGKKVIKFWNDNTVLIVGGGIIIGIHWMWYKIQQVPQLVPENERKEMPIIQGVKYLTNTIGDRFSSLQAGLYTSEPKKETKD